MAYGLGIIKAVREQTEFAIKQLREQMELARYIVFVFLGAGINLTVALGLVVQGVPSLRFEIRSDFIEILTLAIAYLVLGMVYSTITSLSFHPKRIVSPNHIQTVTIPFVATVVVVIILVDPEIIAFVTKIPSWLLVSLVGLLAFFTAAFLLVVMAWIQTPVVRYLVGLNGTKDDMLPAYLLVKAKLSEVLNALNPNVLYALGVGDGREIKRDTHLFATAREHQQQFFVIVCPDSENREWTQIAAISYELDYYGIGKPPRTEIVHKGRINQLKEALKKLAVDSDPPRMLEPASTICHEHALECTESKIMTLTRLPKRHLVTLVGALAMGLIMTGLWHFKLVNMDLLQTFIVFALLAILFDFVPAFGKLKSRLSAH